MARQLRELGIMAQNKGQTSSHHGCDHLEKGAVMNSTHAAVDSRPYTHRPPASVAVNYQPAERIGRGWDSHVGLEAPPPRSWKPTGLNQTRAPIDQLWVRNPR